MGTLKQDYQNWKKARAEAKYCINAMNNYQHEIEVSVSYEEWVEFANKIVKAYASLGKVQKSLTQTEFDKKYEDEMRKLHAKSCFVRVFFEPAYVPFSERPNDLMLALSGGIHKCINNNPNGTIYETYCAGCPKFGELVKYQTLASNAKSALEREHVAKMVLMKHFRIFRMK